MSQWPIEQPLGLTVDHGYVFCPVRQARVAVSRCVTCPYLAARSQDDRSVIIGVVCAPSRRALSSAETD